MEDKIIAAIVMGIIITLILIGVGVLVFLRKISLDLGFAIFIAIVTAINFGLSSSIGSMNGQPQKQGLIALTVLNSIVITFLLFYLGITTYTQFQKTSVQTNYRYIHVLIPVCIVTSIVTLSATAMKQLVRKR